MFNKFPVRDSKYYPFGAYANQGGQTYQGSDQWGYKVLPTGTILAQLDYLPNRGELTETASQFFTSASELEKHRDSHTGKINTAALSERLQVMAHRFNPDSAYNYSPLVSIYEVVEPMPVAFAKVTDNVAFGAGGADQFFSVDEKFNLIHRTPSLIGGNEASQKIGYLKLVDQVESYETKPSLKIYDDIVQQKASSFSQVKSLIHKHQIAYKDALALSGDKTALNVMLAMNERVGFSQSVYPKFSKNEWDAMRDTAMLESLPNKFDLESDVKTLVENIRASLLKADNSISVQVAENSNLGLYQGNLEMGGDNIIAPVKNLRIRNAAEIDIGIKHEPEFSRLSGVLRKDMKAIYPSDSSYENTLKFILSPKTTQKELDGFFKSNSAGLAKPIKKGMLGRVDEGATKRAFARVGNAAKDLKNFVNARRIKLALREQEIKDVIEAGLPKPSAALSKAYENVEAGKDIMSGVKAPLSLKGIMNENAKLSEILEKRRDLFGVNDVAAKRASQQVTQIKTQSAKLSKAISANKNIARSPGISL